MSGSSDRPGVWHKAVGLACRLHDGQMRKDEKTPYIAHPFRVAMIVRDLFGCDDATALAAALLHDAIEDTKADYEDVEACIGAEGARIVAVLTKDMRLPEEEREPAYDAGVRAAGWKAKLVKLADCYDNLTDVAEREDSKDPAKAIDKARRAIACAKAGSGRGGERFLERGIGVLEALIARTSGP